MSGFFIAYFTILRHPTSTPVQLPFTTPDHWIPFQPAALIPYASLWLFVMLPSALMVCAREIIEHALGAFGLSAAGLLSFIAYPTVTPPSGIDWTTHPQIQFLKTIDATGNACPSLHVAFAVFAACWLSRLLRRLGAGSLAHAINVLWAATIVYSTLATRQHVAIDALAGALLGGTAAFINLRLCPQPSEPTGAPAAS